MGTRKVRVYGHERKEGNTHYDRVCVGEGMFHQFSMDHVEYETGPGNFATAIVEMPDGTVINEHVSLIEFIK
jgi:hypothetical protein